MIQISQLKLKTDHTEADLKRKLLKILHLKEDSLLSYQIRKQSIDARKKPELYYVYTVEVETTKEKSILAKNKNPNITLSRIKNYQFLHNGSLQFAHRPVIIGSGPAGLFCTYALARSGYRPILLERGMPVEERIKDVESFWKTGTLKPDSNVQFGEGGAGTFSDGKLNTLVKDENGRNFEVLKTFAEHGAPKNILYASKPHIGTDILAVVVKNMRKKIIENGGTVLFHTQVTDIVYAKDKSGAKILKALKLKDTLTGKISEMDTDTAVLAIGHSARDTFETLHSQGIPMEAKSFAVGIRIEHPQSMIDLAQYGLDSRGHFPAASYKLTANLPNKRGVYTFCMCPGGYVVNASSENGRLAVNGMSYQARDGVNANSAVIVTVTPEDYGGDSPLAGIHFQRRLEEHAYLTGNGKVPVQLFGDFCHNKVSAGPGDITPQIKGDYVFANVRSIFPDELSDSLEQGIRAFDRRIPGYAREDALISGVESRTSSPVRILRDQNLESGIKGLYPCGEGAGYAGGITSAAMDGLKTAEAIARKYHPFDIRGE